MAEKDAGSQPAQPAGVLDNASSPGQSVVAEKSSTDAKVHEFNEQTHYVPKKTIITVPAPKPYFNVNSRAKYCRFSWLVPA